MIDDREEQSPVPRYKDQYANQVSDAIHKLTPPERGWILAFVILVLGAFTLDYFQSMTRAEAVSEHLTLVEKHRAEEMRRQQEINRHLADALVRAIEQQEKHMTK